uniref:Acyl-ACP thioesterase n=1 Tax=Tanacetum cinerariifolium TaxID=118510 RepID=A0A6L2L6K0_TANCI|nr:acyl-ACP thioesterase [Tanacetum cinerariifolium]
MVATAATASLLLVSSLQPNTGGKTGGGIKGVPSSVDVRRIKTKSVNGGMQIKANAHALQRTFINKLPDWSMILATITTIFLAVEKQWMMLELKTKRHDMLADLDPFGLGRIV